MNIGTQILKIRKEKALTQEEFGKIFHVTTHLGQVCRVAVPLYFCNE